MCHFLASVVKFDRKPFFFDDFVIGTAVKDVGVAIDFVALAHGNQACEFFGKELADFGDIRFGNVLASRLDPVAPVVGTRHIGGASACIAGEPHAELVVELSERKRVAVVQKFGGCCRGGENICIAENRTYDAVFVIHQLKDNKVNRT